MVEKICKEPIVYLERAQMDTSELGKTYTEENTYYNNGDVKYNQGSLYNEPTLPWWSCFVLWGLPVDLKCGL